MDINEIKLKDILALQNLFTSSTTATCPFIDKYVIIRSNGSGVHSGYLKSFDSVNKEAYLTQSRRLWKWRGFTLSAVANIGMSDNQAKVCQELPQLIVTNVLEIIPCTCAAKENLSKYPVYVP